MLGWIGVEIRFDCGLHIMIFRATGPGIRVDWGWDQVGLWLPLYDFRLGGVTASNRRRREAAADLQAEEVEVSQAASLEDSPVVLVAMVAAVDAIKAQ